VTSTSYLLGVDIGGSKIAVLARELRSEKAVYADKIKTPAEEGVGAILRLLDEQVENVPGGRASLKALGVAVPGPVDHTGHVLRAGNLKGWVDIPLREMLEDRYDVPVYVERDANCGAIGEQWFGAREGHERLRLPVARHGRGRRLVPRWQALSGRAFRRGREAGEMTFPTEGSDPPPRVSDVVGKRSIQKKAKRATGEKMSAAEALTKSQDEPRLERVTEDVVEYLSSLTVAISSLLDPEGIIFGGGTSKAGEALLKRVRERAEAHAAIRARLLLAKLGSESMLYDALWGAGKMADAR